MALDSGLIDRIIHQMQFDDKDIKKEACFALANTTCFASIPQY